MKVTDSFSEKQIERFWSCVDIPEDRSQCWLWTKHTNYGYGYFNANYKNFRTHRVSYELHFGEIPHGLLILHKRNCTNRACVNPAHLYCGTHQDNADDTGSLNRRATGLKNGKYTMPEKTPRGKQHWSYTKPERTARGERQGLSRLTEKQVLAIRSKYVPFKYGTPALAKEYSVTHKTIWHIVNYRTWKHVP